MDKIKILELLIDETNTLEKTIRDKFLSVPSQRLHERPKPHKWSPIECIAHLNQAGGYYLPLMEKGIQDFIKANKAPKSTYSKGILGGFMAKTMRPGVDQKLSFPMKTFPKFQPQINSSDQGILLEFLEQQEKMRELLKLAKNVDLGNIKITSAIGSILRFKIGDCFQFVVNHNQRHVYQALQGLK